MSVNNNFVPRPLARDGGSLVAARVADASSFERIVASVVESNARAGTTLPPGGKNFVCLRFVLEGLTCFAPARNAVFMARVETGADGVSRLVAPEAQSAECARLLRRVVAAQFN